MDEFDVDTLPRYGRTILQRLYGMTSQSRSGCWQWTGYVNELGYGTIKIGGKTKKAHRAMYEQLIGVIPDELELDHLCRNRACVRPEHLEPVTRKENNQRAGKFVTSCPANHLYSEENTYVDPKGRRYCRACQRIRNRKIRGTSLGQLRVYP